VPIEMSTLNSLHCSWHEGICLIDGYGYVKRCRHSEKSIGNITSAGIEDIWENTRSNFNDRSFQKQMNIINKRASDRSSVEIDGSLFPIPLYRLRPESFGAVLIKGYDFVKISKMALKILDTFKGKQSLKDIAKKFGKESLSFVYGLFEHNMIRFSRKE
jgi:hypothetical protein